MKTLKEFREDIKKDGYTKESFKEFFSQWLELNNKNKLNNAEQAAYSDIARKYRKMLGLIEVNKIMDEVTK